MKHSIRITLISIGFLASGLMLGFQAGKSIQLIQLEAKVIAFNKAVKNQDHFYMFKLGELAQWDKELKTERDKL